MGMTLLVEGKMSFENRLQQVLVELNLSQSELARRVGVTAQSVQGWCSGVLPRKDKLQKLSEVTERPVYWFFIEPDDPIVPELADTKGIILDEQESKLIEFYKKFPESEKKHMLSLFEEKTKEYDRLLAELIKLKGNI